MPNRSRRLARQLRPPGAAQGRHLGAGPDLHPTGGRSSLQDSVLDLQRDAGNRATTSLLTGRLADVGAAPGRTLAAAKGDGVVDDVGIDPDDVHEKDPDGKGDIGGAPSPGRAEARIARGVTGPGLRLEPDLGLQASTPEEPGRVPSGVGPMDAVNPTSVTTTFTNPGNKTVTPFGSESFKPTASGIAYQSPEAGVGEGAGAAPTVKVQLTVDVACPWGTTSGGKTDVTSGTAGVVTSSTYKDIAKDLTPAKKEKSWVAPRSTYWSQATCARHEKFHSTDDKAWAESTGKRIVADYLKTQTVSPDSVDADVRAAIARGLKSLSNENFQTFYKGGATSYYSYAGEERAFGDGKAPYESLVADVMKQGAALEAAEKTPAAP